MENGKWLVGIDVGGTSVKLAFLTEQGDILHKWEIPTNKANKGESVIQDIADAIHSKLAELNVPHEKLKGAGVGAPGPVDTEKGLIFEAVNIGWENNYPLRDLMQSAIGVPVAIENDANSAALGEMWKGAGKGAKDLICITLGTGVGGGVIVNGDIVHGSKGAAGEVGHITAVPSGGYMCNCGKPGCLETVASATGIVRTAKDLLAVDESESKLKEVLNNTGDITAKDIFVAAEAGDKLALSTIDSLANHLGLALANIGSVFNPEKVVIGGGVSQAGSLLLDPIEKYFKKYAFKPVGESTEIVKAELGNDAGIAGAAWLAANKI
ncbi:ROK family glucokinase [Lederbergia citrea]|uniref:Glucokinase n=1 Tax=Lederbergia citrea TaxID=2833581 RepID=A0A942UPD7_9BACI|nr:ROK family glucokinase [Lederbergia citrea]MBS4176344.1 ROK family glucokinase [Lederbergia citrea]MBS4202905.1 ROK family glucokinase [Lederbergia citrea]MBS4222428.1 ROK family glucokinase [Lederbergia citrea]